MTVKLALNLYVKVLFLFLKGSSKSQISSLENQKWFFYCITQIALNSKDLIDNYFINKFSVKHTLTSFQRTLLKNHHIM